MIHRSEYKSYLHGAFRMLPAVFFFLFVIIMMTHSYSGKVKKLAEGQDHTFEGFVVLSDKLESVLEKNLYKKNSYINLNGLVTRMLGINSLNERQKLANGYLASFKEEMDVSSFSDKIIDLNEFSGGENRDFLYLLAPGAASVYDARFAPGYDSDACRNIDSMIDALSQAGVLAVDLDAWFEGNHWDTEDVFFKTDHHWLPGAALAAARCVMERLSEQGAADYYEPWLNEVNWEVTVLEDAFLGSDGKRTGTAYAGVDDMPVYEPTFPVDYTYSGLKEGTSDWQYHENLIDWDALEERDYFSQDLYRMYMYEDYPISRIINSYGYNKKRVLITGDSYKTLLEYFLSTQFQEIYTIDLRYYTDGTFVEYIEEIQPDIVIMCTYEGSFSVRPEIYNFGVKKFNRESAKTDRNEDAVMTLENLEVPAVEDNKKNFTVVYSILEQGQTYTLTLDSASLSGGDDTYIQMTLKNLSANKAIRNRYFEIDSTETQKWIFTVPESTKSVYAICLYAGTNGHTKGVSAKVTNIQLMKGVR